MNSNKKAYIFASIAVFFWSTVATAFKIALREYDFIQLIFYASGITTVFLFAVLLFQNKTKLLAKQNKKQWFTSMLLGAFNPAFYYLVLFKAYSLLPAQLAQPLNMVWPITLALLSVPLLKQKLGWKSLMALIISFFGVIILSSQGGFSGIKNTNFFGVFLALASSVFWSLYWIFHVRDKRDELVKLFMNFVFGFLFLVPVVLLFSEIEMIKGNSLIAVIYVGFFEAGISYIFWLKAMQLTSNNTKIGNLVFFAPFVSLVFIRLILKETIYTTTFIGLIFIVAGVLVQQLDKTAKTNNG